MPSLQAVRASNQAWKPTFRPVIVVAGGTNGIGAGMATAFAKYAPKDKNAPYIILIGRSQQGADTVIAEMKKFNSAGQYEFIKGDLSLMKSVRSVADEVAGKVDKINYLCMSQGILSIKAQDDTTEGIDRKASLHFYSRFLLANLLLPKVEKAAEKGEEARVVSVLAAGQGGAIDVNNMNLSNASLKRKADYATTYNDLMIEAFAQRYPKISFTHIFPGFVNTNLGANLPFYLRIPAMIVSPLATSPADCAEYMLYNLLRPEHKVGAYFIDNKANGATKSQYFGNEDVRKKVWDHAVEVTGLSEGK